MIIEKIREKAEQTDQDSDTDRVDSAKESGPTVPGQDIPEPTEGARGPRGCSGDADQENEQTDEQPAWAVLESDVLNGEKFLLVRDDVYSDDELRDRVTDQARQQVDVTYRMTEMNHITAANLSDERKRELHELKKAFGGDVLGEDPAGEAVPMTEFGDWLDSKT